ncbi:MAG: TIGR04283 family arsenosugar biosynthesis glycosyltransferase [Bacteroidota bacterium]
MTDRISIIIPILNEAETIGQLIHYLSENTTEENIAEIIIVDGGSTDGSFDIVSAYIEKDSNLPKSFLNAESDTLNFEKSSKKQSKSVPELNLVSSEKGRAKQMNNGVKHASGHILYFLHADSFPPKNFDNLIISEVNKGNLAGCFRLQFESNHWWLRLASWLTQFTWRACRGGDQSQFITKALFESIGGYDETYTIYEDNILINELYARNEFTVINKKLKTSARRYEKKGVWRLQYHFWTIYVKKWFGASADELYAYYKKNIN